jgi:hypothetical protein
MIDDSALRYLVKLLNNPDLVYLASPYTHVDPEVRETRFREVCALASSLMSRGIKVFSPIAHSHPILIHGRDCDPGWAHWKAFDLHMLAKCDVLLVYTLDGWEESTGVQAEIEEAEFLSMRRLYFGGNHIMEVPAKPVMLEYCSQCGASVGENDFHACEGVPGGFADTE